MGKLNHLILFCILMGGANASATLEPSLPLKQGVALHFQGNGEAAYSFLQKINPETLEYKYAFSEMQKIHYRQKQWAKFFGFAAFYRKNLIADFFDPNLLLLETLALIKHCQFMTALNLIQFGKSLALLLKSEPVNNPTLKALWSTELKRHHHSQASFNKVLTTFQERLQSMQDLLLLQKKLPGQVRTISEENSMAVFSSQIQWHIDNLEQRNKILKLAVKNPNSVRVFVKNECEGQAS